MYDVEMRCADDEWRRVNEEPIEDRERADELMEMLIAVAAQGRGVSDVRVRERR